MIRFVILRDSAAVAGIDVDVFKVVSQKPKPALNDHVSFKVDRTEKRGVVQRYTSSWMIARVDPVTN